MLKKLLICILVLLTTFGIFQLVQANSKTEYFSEMENIILYIRDNLNEKNIVKQRFKEFQRVKNNYLHNNKIKNYNYVENILNGVEISLKQAIITKDKSYIFQARVLLRNAFGFYGNVPIR